MKRSHTKAPRHEEDVTEGLGAFVPLCENSRPRSPFHWSGVLSILAILGFSSLAAGTDLEDFAQIYVDQYFAPPISAGISGSAENKAEALAYFTVGRMQENKERWDEAIASYLKVLELQPDQLELARKCALILASRSGKQETARELLESTLQQNPGSSFPHIMLSEFLSTYHSNNQDHKDRSLSLAIEAVAKFPTDPMTYEHLAKMYLLGKRKEEAQALLKGALEKKNTDPEFWIRLGKIATQVWSLRIGVEENKTELAILNQFYSRATEHAGTNDGVNERAADFYLVTRQFDMAEQLYHALIKRKPDDLDLRQKLASVCQEKGDTGAYIETLLGIVEINPSDVMTLRKIAGAYKEQEDMGNSVKYERLALKIGKGAAKDYLRVASEMLQVVEDMLKNKADEPQSSKILHLNQEAIKFLKEAVYLFPNDPDFTRLITFPLRNTNQYKEAIKYFEACEKTAAASRPEMLGDRFYFAYASTVERDGDIDRATKLFQKTIELIAKQNPENEDKDFRALVYNYLGYMWLENDLKIEEAGELIKAAVDLDPESGAIADSLGWFYFKKGRFEDAKKELLRSEALIEQAVKLSEQEGKPVEPLDAVILDHIAQTYYALGEREKAIDYMQRAVKLEPEKKEYSERLTQYKSSPAPTPSPPKGD